MVDCEIKKGEGSIELLLKEFETSNNITKSVFSGLLFTCLPFVLFIHAYKEPDFHHDFTVCLVPFIFCLVGIAISWYAAILIFNKKKIYIDKTQLYVSSVPILSFNTKLINIAEISNLDIGERENNYNDYYHGKGDVSSTIIVIKKNNEKVTIARLKNKEEAEFIKQKVEQYLNDFTEKYEPERKRKNIA
ncbi:MAG: hypothetical protein D3924_19520 [Candidatus Electrothrix sp. AR4]|nr:hypothetical protein [Candidatus Electrothrix sp. AR4]